MRRQLFAILLFLSLFAAASARADTYPWVKVGTDDIQVLETPPIDYEFRLALIRSAKTSIDIANYETRADIDPTFPLLTALREAADRGVQIRFITSWIPSELFDNHWFVPGYFMNPPARTPIQFAFSGGTIAQDNGWNLSDSIHEKLMIIDHQIAFTGGRGYGANYLRWIDTGFAMRGPLVAQATQAFEHLWETVLSIQGRFAGSKFWNDSPRLESELEKYSPTAATTLRPDERPRLEHLVQWAHEAPSAAPCGRARLLHFDLLRQLAVRTPTPSEVSYDERAKTLDDPILNALMERLPDAREIRISSLSTILRKDFAQALLRVAKRPGVLVHYIVNAFTPSLTATADTKRAFEGPVWFMELPDLDDLLSAGLDVRHFEPNSTWLYIHRKLAIVDSSVFIGSHNFNLPSSVATDEMSFQIDCEEFAAKVRPLVDVPFETMGTEFDRKWVHHLRPSLKARFQHKIWEPYLGTL